MEKTITTLKFVNPTNEGKIINRFNTPQEASEILNLNIGRIYYSCANSTLIKGTNFYFKGVR